MRNEDWDGMKDQGTGKKPAPFHWLCLAACFAYFLGQPPVHFPLSAWISCALFAWIVADTKAMPRRYWLASWGSASLMWLALLQGIRLAFWPLTFGWIALSLYLAVYFPVALGIGISLHHRYRFRLPWACAIAWTTTELLRSYVITGFAACSLVHSQTPWPAVIQAASEFGGIGVGFLMMLTSAWLIEKVVAWRTYAREVANTQVATTSPNTKSKQNPTSRWWLHLLQSLPRNCIAVWIFLTAATWISRSRYLEELAPIKPLGRFLLIQENMPTMFDMTVELLEEGSEAYLQTTKRAFEALEGKTADVLVWPESIYTQGSPTILWDQGPLVPPELMVERSQLAISVHGAQLAQDVKLAQLRRAAQGASLPNLLMGTDVFSIVDGKLDRYNAALWIPINVIPSNGGNPSEEKLDYYAKQHLVMFGEYIPVLSWFPSVMQSIGMGTLSVGKEAKSWRLKSGRRITTNVCFEDVVPHLMQRQLRELKKRGESPDVMINISNDGWFHGSSILNHHLNSAIVTAVENRIPVLVASNTGISAWIDGDGRVVEQLPKLQGGWIIAEPTPDGREGMWSWWGDKPAWAVAFVGLFPCMRWIVCRLRRRP